MLQKICVGRMLRSVDWLSWDLVHLNLILLHVFERELERLRERLEGLPVLF